ncbi:MAG TPA: DUF1801 domain-containing protein [Dongiaceae bacterium]|nr:DUF1801 domain-containing protein [Dongiaceae bacterium]
MKKRAVAKKVRGKKAAGRKSRSVATASGTPKDFEAYLAFVPEHGRTQVRKLRKAIKDALPGDVQEVISYKMPAFRNEKGLIVFYAGFVGHVSLFPTGGVLHHFAKELQGYPVSKGTVRFPIEKPLPLPLIKKIVEFRLAQLSAKSS